MPEPLKPVIFVNPNIFTPVMRVGPVNDDRQAGSNVSLRDEPIDALSWLAARMGAIVVGTANPITGTDARDMLTSRGLRCVFGPDWTSHEALSDRYAAARAWLARHGARRCVIIDTPPAKNAMGAAAPAGSIVVSIAEGSELNRGACDRVAVMVTSPPARL